MLQTFNLAFKNLLIDDLKENHQTTFIYLGTCALHTANNAFGKVVKELSEIIDLNQMAIDFHFFGQLMRRFPGCFKRDWCTDTAPCKTLLFTMMDQPSKFLLNSLNSFQIWWNTFWKYLLNYLDSMVNTEFPQQPGAHA